MTVLIVPSAVTVWILDVGLSVVDVDDEDVDDANDADDIEGVVDEDCNQVRKLSTISE